MEKMVTIRLPLTRSQKDDVYIAVNGRNMQLQRGVDVEIPESFAEVLANRERVLAKAIEFEEKAAGALEKLEGGD